MRPIIALLAGPALALVAGLAFAQDADNAPMAGMDHTAMAAGDADAASGAPSAIPAERVGREGSNPCATSLIAPRL